MKETQATRSGRSCPECELPEFEPTGHEAALAAAQRVRATIEAAEPDPPSRECITSDELRENVLAALQRAKEAESRTESRAIAGTTKLKE